MTTTTTTTAAEKSAGRQWALDNDRNKKTPVAVRHDRTAVMTTQHQ